MATKEIDKAVLAARKIRRNLLRARHFGTDLEGACGLASILLSIAVNDVGILRLKYNHVWAEVNNVIIDITATQFSTEINIVRGVLVSRLRVNSYHKDIVKRGLPVYLEVVNDNWYNNKDHSRWGWISEYWL